MCDGSYTKLRGLYSKKIPISSIFKPVGWVWVFYKYQYPHIQVSPEYTFVAYSGVQRPAYDNHHFFFGQVNVQVTPPFFFWPDHCWCQIISIWTQFEQIRSQTDCTFLHCDIQTSCSLNTSSSLKLTIHLNSSPIYNESKQRSTKDQNKSVKPDSKHGSQDSRGHWPKISLDGLDGWLWNHPSNPNNFDNLFTKKVIWGWW